MTSFCWLLLIQNHCQEPKSHDSRIHWASDNNKLRITDPSIFCNRARETVITLPYPKLRLVFQIQKKGATKQQNVYC